MKTTDETRTPIIILIGGSFLGILALFAGLVGLAIFLGIFFAGDMFDTLLGISLYQSRWVPSLFGAMVLGGLCLQAGILMELGKLPAFVSYALGFLVFVASLGMQLYKIFTLGFQWMGRELLQTQAAANDRWFQYLGMALLAFGFILVVYSGGLTFKKRQVPHAQ